MAVLTPVNAKKLGPKGCNQLLKSRKKIKLAILCLYIDDTLIVRFSSSVIYK